MNNIIEKLGKIYLRVIIIAGLIFLVGIPLDEYYGLSGLGKVFAFILTGFVCLPHIIKIDSLFD